MRRCRYRCARPGTAIPGARLREAGAPPDRVARQLLRALAGPSGPTDPMDDWILSWLARHRRSAGRPGTPGGGGTPPARSREFCPAGSARHGLLVSRLADTLYRVGDAAEAEQVASLALAHGHEPDVLVDLHWTLAQCRLQAGKSAESLDALHRALARPRNHGPAPRAAAGACRPAPQQPRRSRKGRRHRPRRAGGRDGSGRQLGDGLGAARADRSSPRCRGRRPTRCRCSTARWP